jgi:hypothetical protein
MLESVCVCVCVCVFCKRVANILLYRLLEEVIENQQTQKRNKKPKIVTKTHFVLSSYVPNIHLQRLVLQRLDIKPNRRYCRHCFVQFHLVQYRRFSCRICFRQELSVPFTNNRKKKRERERERIQTTHSPNPTIINLLSFAPPNFTNLYSVVNCQNEKSFLRRSDPHRFQTVDIVKPIIVVNCLFRSTFSQSCSLSSLLRSESTITFIFI